MTSLRMLDLAYVFMFVHSFVHMVRYMCFYRLELIVTLGYFGYSRGIPDGRRKIIYTRFLFVWILWKVYWKKSFYCRTNTKFTKNCRIFKKQFFQKKKRIYELLYWEIKFSVSKKLLGDNFINFSTFWIPMINIFYLNINSNDFF